MAPQPFELPLGVAFVGRYGGKANTGDKLFLFVAVFETGGKHMEQLRKDFKLLIV